MLFIYVKQKFFLFILPPTPSFISSHPFSSQQCGKLFLIILKFFQNITLTPLNSHLKDPHILNYVSGEKWKDLLEK